MRPTVALLALCIPAVSLATPRMHASALTALYVPRLDQIQDVYAFFERTGQRSSVLNPAAWQSELHPLLWLELPKPDALLSSGIDPAGSYTVSVLPTGRFACATVKDAQAFDTKASLRLKALGERVERKGKTRVVTARVQGVTVAGYALRGDVACAFASDVRADSLQKEAIRRVEKPSAGVDGRLLKGLPGVAFLITSDGIASLDAVPQGLKVRARSTRLPLPGFSTAVDSPYTGAKPSGLLFARGAVTPDTLRGAVRHLADLVARACGPCDRTAVTTAAEVIATRLTGAFLLRVDRAELRGALRTAEGQYFAVKHALLAELSGSADDVRRALAKLSKTSEGNGVVIDMALGQIRLGVQQGQLYLANDEKALTALAQSTGKPGKLAAGLEAFADPKALAKALGQISLLDVMGSRELAGLFAMSAELGPLLQASESLTGKIDTEKDGTHIGEAVWMLGP
jgi:hypothetical protein